MAAELTRAMRLVPCNVDERNEQRFSNSSARCRRTRSSQHTGCPCSLHGEGDAGEDRSEGRLRPLLPSKGSKESSSTALLPVGPGPLHALVRTEHKASPKPEPVEWATGRVSSPPARLWLLREGEAKRADGSARVRVAGG